MGIPSRFILSSDASGFHALVKTYLVVAMLFLIEFRDFSFFI